MARAKRTQGGTGPDRQQSDLTLTTIASTMFLGVLAAEADKRHAAEHAASQVTPDPQRRPGGESAGPPNADAYAANSHEAAAQHDPQHSTPLEPQAGAGGVNSSLIDHAAGPAVAGEQRTDSGDMEQGSSAHASLPPTLAELTAPHDSGGADTAAHVDQPAIFTAGWLPDLKDFAPSLSGGIDAALQSATHSVQQALQAISPALSAVQQTMQTVTHDALGTVDAIGGSAADLAVNTAFSPNAAPGVLGHLLPAAAPQPDAAMPHIDGGAIVPDMAHATPLHLGFMGQSVADAHDPHDGAFSNLALHV